MKLREYRAPGALMPTLRQIAFAVLFGCAVSQVADARELVRVPAVERNSALHAGVSARIRGQLDSDTLQQVAAGALKRLSLSRPDGEVVEIEIEAVRQVDGGFVARGRPSDDVLGTASFAQRGDAVFGIVRYRDGDAIYLNANASTRSATVSRIADAPVAPCDTVSSRSSGVSSACLLETDPDMAEVDVLIIYNRSAREEAGGRDALLALIDLTFSDTNQILANSGANVLLRLLRAEEVDYTNVPGPDPILNKLIDPTDSVLDEVHTLRDQIGADIVQFWSSRIGGQSQILGENATTGTLISQGFSIAGSPNANFPYVLNELISAHEFGHTLGCNHNREASLAGLFPYSFGFVSPSFSAPDATRTLMAVPPPNPRVPFYSNPALDLGNGPLGSPAGAPDAADNAQTISRGGNCIQGFRTAIPGATLEDRAGRLLAFFRNDDAAYIFGHVFENATDQQLTGNGSPEDWWVFSRQVPNRVLARYARTEKRLYLRGEVLSEQAPPLDDGPSVVYQLRNDIDALVATIDESGTLRTTAFLDANLLLRVADQSDTSYFPGRDVEFSITFEPRGLPPESVELRVNVQNDVGSVWRIRDISGDVPDVFPDDEVPATPAEPWVLSWDESPAFPFTTRFSLANPEESSGFYFVDIRARYRMPGEALPRETILYQVQLSELPFAPADDEGEEMVEEGEGAEGEKEGEGEGLTQAEGETGTRAIDDAVLRFTFNEGTGTTIRDVSGFGQPYDLTLPDATAVNWEADGLRIVSPTLIAGAGAVDKVRDRLRETNALTMEAWITTDSLSQSGPAIIAGISKDTNRRNLSLGQAGDQYEVRLRTTLASNNGLPAIATAEGAASTGPQHIVYTRDAAGVARLYIDGELLREDLRAGTLSNWNANYGFVLANESNLARPWLGKYHELTLYDRVLREDEIAANYVGNPLSGVIEGEVSGLKRHHSADTNADSRISLSELLAVVQAYNLGAFRCAGDSEPCVPRDTDFAPRDGVIGLSELLRVVQFYNADGIAACEHSVDGFCPIFREGSRAN